MNNYIQNLLKHVSQLNAFLPEDIKIDTEVITNYFKENEFNDFEILKFLLFSDQWPKAINEHMLCDVNDESEKQYRANSIIDIVVEKDLSGIKFLDFGTGEGHVAVEASRRGALISVGYDINENSNGGFEWEKEFDNLILTKDFDKVKLKAPYDFVLLYDVFDFLGKDTVDVLRNIAGILSPNGMVQIRTHPWSGRFGGRLYHQINKAFVHVVFTDEELEEMGFTPNENVNKVIHPIVFYVKSIQEAGFKIIKRDIMREDIEPFFKTPILKNRIVKHWKHSHDKASRKWPGVPLGQVVDDFLIKLE